MASRKTQYDVLLDELLKDYTTPQEILGAHGLLKQLTKRLVERALDVRFISSLPVMRRPACRAWADKRRVQIVWAEG